MAKPRSSKSYVDALANKYLSEMKAAAPIPRVSRESVSQPSGSQDTAAMQQSFMDSFADAPAPLSEGNWLERNVLDPDRNVGKVIDVISQPLYATAQTLGETITDIQDDGLGSVIQDRLDPTNIAENAGQYLGNFGEGNDKRTVSDIIGRKAEFTDQEGKVRTVGNGKLNFDEDDSFGDKAGKFAFGLGLDIAGDPLSYVGAGAVKNVATAPLKGVRTVKAATEEGTALNRAATSIEKGAESIARPFKVRKVKGREALPTEIDEAADIAQRLDPENASFIERMLAREVDDTAEAATESVMRAADNAGESAEDAMAMSSAAVRDAEKISDGTFVPRVSSKVKIADDVPRANEVQGPVQRVMKMKKTDGARPREYEYDSVVEGLMRRTKNEDADLMYPQIPEELPTPFYTPKSRVTAPVEEVIEEAAPVAAIPEAAPAAPTGKVMPQDVAKAIPKKVIQGKNFEDHFKIAFAGPNAREVLKGVKLADGSFAIKGLGHTSDEAVARMVAQSQKVVSQEVKAAREAAGSATPSPATGTAAAEAPTAQAAAPRLSERLAAVADEGLAAKVDKVAKPDVRKLGGAAKAAYANKLTTTYGIHPVHVQELLAARTEAAFKAKVSKMREWRTDGPMYEVYEQFIGPTLVRPDATGLNDVTAGIRSADDQIAEGVAGAKTAADIAADSERTVGEISKETLEAMNFAVSSSPVTQNWTEIAPDFKFKTLIDETLRTSRVAGEGYGVNRMAFNSAAQANVFRSLINQGEQILKQGEKVTGLARSQFLHDFVLKGLKESDELLRAQGIQPIAGFGKAGMPVSVADLIEVLDSSARGRTLLLDRVFDGFGVSRNKGLRPKRGEINYAGTIKIDALHDAARPVIEFLTREFPDVADLATLEKAVSEITRKGVSQRVMQAAKNSVLSRPMSTLEKSAEGRWVSKTITAKEAEDIAQEAVNALLQPKVVHALLQRAHDNAAAYGIAFGQKVNEITEESITKVLDVLSSPDSGMRTMAETIDSAPKIVRETARETPNINVGITAVAEGKFEEVLTEVISRADRTGAEYVVKIARAVEQGLPRKALDDLFNMYRTGVSEGFHETLVARLSQSGDNAAVAMNSGIAKILQPFGRAFINHWENPTEHAALLSEGNVGRVFQGITRRNLNEVARNFTKEDLVAGMSLLQRGIPLEGALGEEAARGLQRTVDSLFRIMPIGPGAKEQRGITSELFAKGFPVEHVNSKLEYGRLKLPERYRFDMTSAEQSAAANGTSVAEELSKQWTKWDIDDPVDFLARMSAALGSLATDAGVSMEGLRIAQARNLVSNTRRAGFVRLDLGEASVLGKYLPQPTYVHPDIAGEFRRMDEILSRPDRLVPFIDNVVSPVVNKWKAGMTIYHPGHHIRNLIGDTVMSFLTDGVKSPIYYSRAMRMMKPGNNIRGAYSEFDAIAALRGQSEAMTGGGHAARVKVGRQSIDLDDMQVQQYAMNEGILPDFAVQEDIISNAGEGFGSGFANRVENLRPAGGRVQKVAGRLSEARDDYVRMAHFMHVLEHPPKGGYKNIEEAVKYAAERVRKAHPDGSDLTGFERRWMRLVFPFYSWTRKAIPLVIEATFMNPGRVTQYPKAMYNFAQSNGMDLESMSEPFPEGEIFPSFLTDNMTGPLMRDSDGHSISMDFGFPQADVMNEFVANPAVGVSNMLNPLIKAPIEALTGSRLVSKTPINNTTEYLESQIPGLAQAGQLTGYSPVGSAIDAAKGEGPRVQDAVTKGNKEAFGTGSAGGFDSEALMNRTLNFRYTDMNKPSYDRIAQMEERDRTGKAQEDFLKRLYGG